MLFWIYICTSILRNPMTASEFANILEHIATPSEPIESEALKLLIQQYPYYQALHILLAQQPSSPADADAQLKKAATYATDRGMLYQLLLKQRPDTSPTYHTPAEEHPNNTDNTTQPQHNTHKKNTEPDTEPDTPQPHHTASLIDWQAELNDVENEIHTTNTETPHTHPQPETHTTAPHHHNTTNNNEINDEDNDDEEDDDNDLTDDETNDDDNEDEINNPNNELTPPPPAHLTFAQYLQQLKQPHPHSPNHTTPTPPTTTNPSTQPTTQKLKKKKLVKELAKASITENDTLISETLAKLLAIQGKKDKAIKMYRQLSLKYPEKNTYFAAKIEQLKNH